MNKTLAFVSCVVCSVLTGCATHRDVRTSYDPATECKDEFVQTGNGSTNHESHCRSQIPGGADHGLGYGYSPYSTLTVSHPPMQFIPYVGETNSQRAMGDIPGGPVLLHPGALDGVATKQDLGQLQQQVDDLEGDVDANTVVNLKHEKDIKKIKKGGGAQARATQPPPTDKPAGQPSDKP